MEYTNLGDTGLKVSRLCLGTMGMGSTTWQKWVVGEDASVAIVKKAIDIGINFFDTADSYSAGKSEEYLGIALKTHAKRDQVVIATKVYYPTGNGVNDSGLSRKHIMSSIDTSLKNLGTDYVDLYQIHRWDYNTPIMETLTTLDDLVRSGKVRYIGASSMYAWQFSKALHLAGMNHLHKFVTMQNHYSLLYREEEREMIPLCRDQGVGIIPFCPLGRGMLCRPPGTTTERASLDPITNKYYGQDFETEIINRVHELAEKKGVSMAQISLKWPFKSKGSCCSNRRIYVAVSARRPGWCFQGLAVRR